MKPTLLFATLSLVLASPSALAKSELELLRSRCSEQERQIRLLEDENTRLRSGGQEARTPVAKSEPVATAAPKTAAPAAAGPSTYTVKAGDSLEKIARKVGSSPKKLAKSNGLKASSMIHPGQKLKVPGSPAAAAPAVAAASAPASSNAGKTHKVQQGETFSSISRKHGMSTEALVAANPKVKPSALRPGQIVSLGAASAPATTMIAATKAPATVEKAPAPVTEVKPPVVHQNIPVSTAAPVSKPMPAPVEAAAAPETRSTASTPATQPVAEKEKETVSPTPEKKIRPVTIDGEMTYGEFASKHGTDAERLNALNGLDLTTATVLAKGSELYVPAQP
ncbi:MAG: LysM peptidoglycan-binding domain-containing protein [Verrucomicrobiota bacterium]